MTPEKPKLPVEMKAAEPLRLSPPERLRRVTVADVIGPEATQQAIEEERNLLEGTQYVGPRLRRRTRVDELLTEEEGAQLEEEIGRQLRVAARARWAHAKRWHGR